MIESPTLALADFATRTRTEDIPSRVRDKVRILCLDAIGCAAASVKKAPIAGFVSAIQKMDDGHLGSIWGFGLKASLPNVALANGTMIHFLEMDDVHKASLMHPAASIVPSTLAACEVVDTTGRNFIGALVIGYEIALRIGMAVGPVSHRNRGWHVTGSCGMFGAATAVGRILHLNRDKMSWAMGLAGIQPTGTYAFAENGSMNKPFHAGRAAQGGLLAAFLAQDGFTGPSNILEAKDGGFFKAVSDEFDLSKITNKLGEKYEALDSFAKVFPCCTYQHAPLSAIFKILEKHSFMPENVERIIVKTNKTAKKSVAAIQVPTSVVQAQFCLPYGIAVSIIDQEATLKQFSSDRIQDRQVIDLAKKVEVIVDPEIDRQFPEKFPAEVEIWLKDGKRVAQYVSGPPGEPENPVGDEVVEKKFAELSSPILSSERVEKIIDFFRDLESQRSMKDLVKLLAVTP